MCRIFSAHSCVRHGDGGLLAAAGGQVPVGQRHAGVHVRAQHAAHAHGTGPGAHALRRDQSMPHDT